jgi:hypothetical protein
VAAAQRRARELALPCQYVAGEVPVVPLWTWDKNETRLRLDRSNFARSYHNDTYPARGATEWQWTVGQVITALIAAGLEIRHLAEHPEPFGQPRGVAAAAWQGRLPNTCSLLAQRGLPSA